MQSWVKLARSTVLAEWPEFELLQSFALFSLDDNGVPLSQVDQQTKLERLSVAFLKSDDRVATCAKVRRQYDLCRPFAVKLASGSPASAGKKDFEFWMQSAKRARQNKHDVDQLMTLIHHGLASTGASTANSERDFAAVRKRSNNTAVAEVERILQTYPGSCHDKTTIALCKRAQRIWRCGFGRPRASGPKKRKNFRRPLNHKRVS